MGVDLTLLPFNAQHNDLQFSHTILPLNRDSDLWAKIEKLESYRIEGRFSTYLSRVRDGSMEGESCYGDTPDDPYGEPLRYVLAGDLCRLLSGYNTHPAAWQTIAATRFVSALPPEIRIALYWH